MKKLIYESWTIRLGHRLYMKDNSFVKIGGFNIDCEHLGFIFI
jgi:hypothetical protein